MTNPPNIDSDVSCKILDIELIIKGIVTSSDAVQLAERLLSEIRIENARLEAQLITALAWNADRTSIIAKTASPSDSEIRARFAELLFRRMEREPLAYLRGTQEFYGLPYIVSPATLIPRPETELLVEFALGFLFTCKSDKPVFADAGTGSGCIALSILRHHNSSIAYATDVSDTALNTALRNAVALGVENRIQFRNTSLLEKIPAGIDLVVSNPPYIPTGELNDLQPEVSRYEPRLALDGGDDGLRIYRQLSNQLPAKLKPGGHVAVECGMGQAKIVSSIFESDGLINVNIHKDLAGIERVVSAIRP